ncbi:MAG: sel1 repeat family protein [Candidatus Brocadiaceae bacterium]|nr:sel1 repeat family protein [Candidatus Brocadiaceae bacterium]
MKSIIAQCIIAMLLMVSNVTAEQIKGTIKEKTDDRIRIELEGDLQPNVGDPLRIEASIAGRIVDGGAAEITETGDGFVWAKILSGKPNIKMAAIITSKNPMAANATPEMIYQKALEIIKKTLNKGEDPFAINVQADWDSSEFSQAYPLFLRAAESGVANAQFFVYLFKSRGGAKGSWDTAAAEARIWLKKAAEGGQKYAQYHMSRSGLGGLGESDRWLRSAADQGHGLAAIEMAQKKGISEPDLQKYSLIAAENGDAHKLWLAASMISKGPRIEEVIFMLDNGHWLSGRLNLKLAVVWLKSAAEKGHAFAMRDLADLYHYGGRYYPVYDEILMEGEKAGLDSTLPREMFKALKMPVDTASAIKWYEKVQATSKQSKEQRIASFRLGNIFSDPDLGFQDFAKAKASYEHGLKHRSAVCGIELSKMYRDGRGVEASPDKAFATLLEAGPHENKFEASVLVASYLMEGIGTPRNRAEAKRIYEAAIKDKESPNGFALIALGDMYRNGTGVEPDVSKARDLYTRVLQIVFDMNPDTQRQEVRTIAQKRLQSLPSPQDE